MTNRRGQRGQVTQPHAAVIAWWLLGPEVDLAEEASHTTSKLSRASWHQKQHRLKTPVFSERNVKYVSPVLSSLLCCFK